MPVKNVTVSNVFSRNAMRQPVYSEKNASNNVSFKADSKNQEHKSKKLPYVAAGIAIAALAGAYTCKDKIGFKTTAKKIFDGVELNNPQRLKKISDIKGRCAEEFENILKSNTIFGDVKLNLMDEAANLRALDKARPDYLDEAANMAEEAYKAAYQKAVPPHGKNILDMIFFRIDKESKTLPKIYAKMPKEDAYERMYQFSKSAAALDAKEGMLSGQLFNKLVEFMNKEKM